VVIETKEQKENVAKPLYSTTVNVTQEFGKGCSKLWLALYCGKEAVLKNFFSYQWCTIGTPMIFEVPKAGLWTFRLFPSEYVPILTLEHTIKGENTLQLSVENNVASIKYNITTLDVTTEKPWIAIHIVGSTNNDWKRYKYITDFVGIISIDVSSLAGNSIEARLFDYYNTSLHQTSNAVQI